MSEAKIKFNKFAVTNGTLKARVFYSVDNRTDGRKCVTIYAKDYNSDLGLLFKDSYKNDTDTMTDYFDKGKVVLFEDHPSYADARMRATEGKEVVQPLEAPLLTVAQTEQLGGAKGWAPPIKNNPLTKAFKALESVPVSSFTGVGDKKPAMGRRESERFESSSKEVAALEYVKGEIRRRLELAEKRADETYNNLVALYPDLKGIHENPEFKAKEDRVSRLSIALGELEAMDLWADLSDSGVKV